MDGGRDPDSPPWNRLSAELKPKCNMDVTGQLPKRVFRLFPPSFCQEVDLDKSKALSKAYTNKDISEMPALLRRTPPPDPKGYEGYAVNLKWTGSVGECRHDCAGAFHEILESPCKSVSLSWKD